MRVEEGRQKATKKVMLLGLSAVTSQHGQHARGRHRIGARAASSVPPARQSLIPRYTR